MSETVYTEDSKRHMSETKEVKHMPMRNGTGPQGMGPMTGRGMGPCRSNVENYGYGLGRGMGQGRGINCRRMGLGYGMGMNMPVATPEMQKEFLTRQKLMLENQLKAIDERLNGISE